MTTDKGAERINEFMDFVFEKQKEGLIEFEQKFPECHHVHYCRALLDMSIMRYFEMNKGSKDAKQNLLDMVNLFSDLFEGIGD